MRILLTHGYFLQEDVKEQAIMKPYPPLGILYISAWLEQHGYDNEVFDSTFSSREAWKARVLELKPDVIGIYINLMTKLNVLKLMDWVKQQTSLEHTRIIIGGPDVRYNAERLLNHGADFCIIGEGEESMLELVQALDKNTFDPNQAIAGVAYLHSGSYVQGPERALLRSTDELPYPNRKKINLQQYLDTWKEHHGQSSITVSSMRGCPYTCHWCSRAVYGMSYRRRSPQSVVAEMKMLKETYQPDAIWFVDDVFSINVRWLKQFKDEVLAQDALIPYECITRADKMNESVLQDLKDSGCFRVWIGAESGSQKIIDLMERRVSVEKTREMIRLAKDYGIEAGTFIMLGYPGETEADIEETIRHLKLAEPDFFTMTVAYPIRGTELYEETEALQVEELVWAETTDRDIDFKRTYPRKYYDYAVRRVYNEVHYHLKKNGGLIPPPDALGHKLRSVAAKAGMRWVRITNS